MYFLELNLSFMCTYAVVNYMHFAGRQVSLLVWLCGCEAAALTLLRSSLWASTPSNPSMAYHVEFLAWLETLLLECHVSIKGFCDAVAFRHHMGKTEVRFCKITFYLYID